MGYYDGLINSWFKRTESGRSIFYPYGVFGTGYALSSNNEVEIRRFLRRYSMISLPTIIVAAILNKLYSFVLLLFLIPIYSIRIRQMLSNAEKTEEKMKLNEATRNMAISMGVPTSILMLAGSFLMTAASVFLIFWPNARTIGILGAIFFGLCLFQSVWLVKYSLAYKKGKSR